MISTNKDGVIQVRDLKTDKLKSKLKISKNMNVK